MDVLKPIWVYWLLQSSGTVSVGTLCRALIFSEWNQDDDRHEAKYQAKYREKGGEDFGEASSRQRNPGKILSTEREGSAALWRVRIFRQLRYYCRREQLVDWLLSNISTCSVKRNIYWEADCVIAKDFLWRYVTNSYRWKLPLSTRRY